MFDFRRTSQHLTQGRPPATMTVATASATTGAEVSAAGAVEFVTAPVDPTPATGDVDVYAVARRVYELMLQELRIERDRRGGQSW